MIPPIKDCRPRGSEGILPHEAVEESKFCGEEKNSRKAYDNEAGTHAADE